MNSDNDPFFTQLLEQLHDIEKIGSISAWPLAIGWWVLIGLTLAGFALVILYMIGRYKFSLSWRSDALKQLSRLEKTLSETNGRDSAIALSNYIRRISLKKYSRKECASLSGEEWLKWLAEKDPHKFDWQKKGRILAEITYMPLDKSPSAEGLKELIQAVKGWVR